MCYRPKHVGIKLLKGFIMKVYGWIELNEACYGQIDAIEIDDTMAYIADDGTEEVSSVELGRGVWFRTFGAAKRAAIQYFREQIEWQREAVVKYRKLRKKDTD